MGFHVVGIGQGRRKNEQSETWCSQCIGVSGVSLGSFRLKGGGRPSDFAGFQEHMSAEGNFSSIFVVVSKSWISDGELQGQCWGRKEVCGLQQNPHSSVQLWGLLGPGGAWSRSRFFWEGRQVGCQLKGSTCSIARIHPPGSPEALGQCEDEGAILCFDEGAKETAHAGGSRKKPNPPSFQSSCGLQEALDDCRWTLSPCQFCIINLCSREDIQRQQPKQRVCYGPFSSEICSSLYLIPSLCLFIAF